MSTTTNSALQKGAIVGGAINTFINGLIYWFKVKDKTSVLLTDDVISSTEHTVFSSAVPLATSLAFILTSIAYFTTKKAGKEPYFPKVFLLALKNAIFAFGTVTIGALLLQKYAGSITVSSLSATIITGIIAGIVAGLVDYLTKKDLL